jgi:hypothetical protein
VKEARAKGDHVRKAARVRANRVAKETVRVRPVKVGQDRAPKVVKVRHAIANGVKEIARVRRVRAARVPKGNAVRIVPKGTVAPKESRALRTRFPAPVPRPWPTDLQQRLA